jgi:hypothetical protein
VGFVRQVNTHGAAVCRVGAALNQMFILEFVQNRRETGGGTANGTGQFTGVLTIMVIERAQDVPLDNGQTQWLNHLSINLIKVPQRNIKIAP